jgi:hypothetical protein
MQHLALLLCGKTDGDVEPDAAEAQEDASFCILIRETNGQNSNQT